MPKHALEVNTKFYTYHQNNSGGYFVGPVYVIIEAQNAVDADRIAEDNGLLQGRDNWCGCCGERWNNQYGDEGTESPMIYGEDAHTYKETFQPPSPVLIRHYDGHTEEFNTLCE